jgi:septum formation protein
MSVEKINSRQIILASSSPRRQELMKGLGIKFTILIREVEEVWPQGMPIREIPSFLADLKADAFSMDEFADGAILITADTVVILDGQVLGKPRDRQDAIEILSKLSGAKHEVITGVCLRSKERSSAFDVCSEVWFRKFSKDEIEWYVDTYSPFDKAGAYGVQEWIGYAGIERINGSFYNVMGLPTQRLYLELEKLIEAC